ncbi:MAG: bifunctional diaminohydroxyphosphoribosylaminopyrimidine deaminase/5-amino-6-(5-phosphoribosylamino)uracil reductase RibD [Rhodospirillaceae bacterium]|nr:bifunctional diaminohydroxyphosphoribosylaminopyrimidine deaminase/5-amino-6-(5-phosphoribosylamino)uracil reductase RibD [Rhodospirillaceae bacterium]
MDVALGLAARNLGDTWPNPTVGCVLVKDGRVVGRGWTQSGGRPHAETEALARAGQAARGATVYVTLEPCSHHGKTPPCADALVAAGVARVVSATTDPDARVNGRGLARLREAGIEVTEGVGKAAADRLNAGFFLKAVHGRPLFALKTATSLDGRIALASGESRWITGESARRAVHALRARYDAILVGSETALTDDPLLTCRLDGYGGRAKVRVVLDRRLRLAPNSELVKTAREIPTWVITSAQSLALPRSAELTGNGVDVTGLKDASDHATFTVAVGRALAGTGLTRVMIEGGGQVAAAFLRAGLIDELAWFKAPSVIGGDGRASIYPMGLMNLADMPRFKARESLKFGEDTLDILAR